MIIKRMILIFTFFIFYIQTSFLLAGITGKIAGKIEDKATGEVLAGANVSIIGTSLGAATSIDGNYFILNIPPGTYDLKISMMGYKATTVTGLRVKVDQTTTLNYKLEPAVLEGEEVFVIAEKPKVEIDLTASKQTMSAGEVNNSWGIELKDVIRDLPGINENGGIRGGYGLDVAYNLNGMDMRDVGSNTNFSLINLTTIQEVEVLTGGFNAEYGQANGAIVNIITRNATDRIHGIVQYKTRPAGKYHWGDNLFADDGIYRGIMTTPEFWNPDTTWQTQWMDEPVNGYDGGRAPYRQMTPEQRTAYWKAFVNDEARFPHMNYADRMEWESEISLYGPLTNKLSFLLSGRYKEGVSKFPSSLKYNPDMTLQGTLDYQLNPNTKLSLSGIFTKFKNAGPPRTFFQSSEETTGQFIAQELSYLRSPYSSWLFWLYGNKGNSDLWTIRPPEQTEFFNFQLKGTHVFSVHTFLDVALQHNFMEYRMDYREIAKGAYFEGFGLPTVELSESGRDTVYVPGWPDDHWGQAPPRSFIDFRWGYPGDTWRNWIDTRSTSLKADLTSQISHNHLIKTGFIFSTQMYDKLLHEGRSSGAGEAPRASVNDIVPTKTTPYEGGFYIQDKMEFEGLVVNAGVRVDFFDPNRRVAKDFFDPYFINDSFGADSIQGLVRYDPNGPDSLYRDTPTKWAISPRLGISHPISENTVLHFMFGIFNQRPSWQKILANPIVYVAPLPPGTDSDLDIPDTTIISYRSYSQRTGNPALTWETMTQWEVGFEQNVVDKFRLDVTLYYKKASNLTHRGGLSQGPPDVNFQSNNRSGIDIYFRGDPENPTTYTPGKDNGDFQTIMNGGYSDVRGIETLFETRFRYFNASLDFTLSFLNTGFTYYSFIYKEFKDGRLGENIYVGAGNDDNGDNGYDDDDWNPHKSAKLRLYLNTPKNFGPKVLGIHPLENWLISTSTTWSEGQEYTYYSPDYTGERRPNNKRWKDRWNTNMNITKRIDLLGGMQGKLFMQITNLFNNKHLRLFSGDDLIQYTEEGQKPVHKTTKEPLVWNWYTNLPREIYFGMAVEF